MASGVVRLDSTDLELTWDSYFEGYQLVGMRFNNVLIPQGATIETAYIQFTVDETENEDGSLIIEGENS